MIGLIFIYFIGKYFYDLAGQFQKSRWGFAILGVISYYAGIVIGGVAVVVFIEAVLEMSVDDIPDMAISLMSIPLGVLACWGFYKLLQNQWTKPSSSNASDALDQDLM